ncbi:MAG: MFS transporter [Anaerolineae bacterium]|nr:MFS transporter [Chloroflexota bacterium]
MNTTTVSAAAPARSGMRTFLIIWAGQLISFIGSGLSGLALAVYLYEQTGAVTQLALSMAAASIPQLLLLPLAGTLVDRWDRRTVLVLSDIAAALVTLAMWALLATHSLAMWHVYLGNAISAAFGAFQRPAYYGLPSLLVASGQYGRVSGLMQLADAASQIVAPIIAGFLVLRIGVPGVFLVDLATCALAVLSFALVRIPNPERQAEAEEAPVLQEAVRGWHYVRARTGLLGMVTLFAIVNFALGFYSALFAPLVLARYGPETLGALFSGGGIAMLVGSLIMSAWGGTRRRIFTMTGAITASGLGIALLGSRPSLLAVTAGNLLIMLAVPFANAASQAIWLAKVPPEVQGRVFAIRMMIASAITPLAYLLAGPLADQVAGPLMAEGGALAPLLGGILGVGADRGIGLILVITGLLAAAAPMLALFWRRIRCVELEIPDHTAAEAALR